MSVFSDKSREKNKLFYIERLEIGGEGVGEKDSNLPTFSDVSGGFHINHMGGLTCFLSPLVVW